MNTAIVIFILVLFCILLAALYLRQRNNTVEKRQPKSNECIVRAHYYMFTLEKYDQLVYVTAANKFSPEQILETKSAILNRLNINEDDKTLKEEFGVSYLGYLSETEFKSKEL